MNPSNHRLIGGKFGFPKQFSVYQNQPAFLSQNSIRFSNARSAIKFLVDHLNPPKVWLPSYLCPTIIQAINPERTKIAFYPVNIQLEIMIDQFVNTIMSDELFILIDYFGFRSKQGAVEQIKSTGCRILRDCSQALFFDWRKDPLCDFFIYSPRKFLGVPDGGVLYARNREFLPTPRLEEPDQDLLFTLFEAMLLRRDFDLDNGDKKWLELFNIGEEQFRPGNSSMSEITSFLLDHAFNYDQIADQRMINYRVLLSKLEKYAIFKELPDETIPLGFPVKIQDRDSVQKNLFKNNIYPPIHWKIKNYVPQIFAESHILGNQIMTLPCDQRYDQDDMIFMADKLTEVFN